METIHPVKDGYKYKNTVVFPGARNLFLKFDPRSASQYDYDKVIVYAGDSPKGTKVAEYGGNTHGFGSRSVLRGGWPSQSVKVCYCHLTWGGDGINYCRWREIQLQ